MKQIKTILVRTIWSLAALYLAIAVSLKTPPVQKWISSIVCGVLEKELGTKVSIGKVEIGLLNRVIIDEVSIYDKSGKEMFRSARLAAKIDLSPLFHNEISISSAQIFGMKAVLYRQNANMPYNFQFVIDSLSSKDSTPSKPLNLHIQSLIIRNGAIKFDQQDKPRTPNKFNTAHLNISHISSHIKLYALTDDSLSLNLKKLSLKESSGLDLRNLTFDIKAGRNKTSIADLDIELPQTRLSIPEATATYKIKEKAFDKNSLKFNINVSQSKITPSDFACFDNSLSSIKDNIALHAALSGTTNSVVISDLNIHSGGIGINIIGNGNVRSFGNSPRWNFHAKEFWMSDKSLQFISDNLSRKRISLPSVLTRVGGIKYNGNISGRENLFVCKGDIKTGIGNAKMDIAVDGNSLRGYLSTKGIHLGKLLDDDKFGILATDIKANGKLDKGKKPLPFEFLIAKGNIERFDYNSYSYRNITIDGSYRNGTADGRLAINDPNGKADINGRIELKDIISVGLTADVKNFNPNALKLTDKAGNNTFSFLLKADATGKSLETMNGSVNLTDFIMSAGKSVNRINSINLTAGKEADDHFMNIESDFGSIDIRGQFNYNTIAQSLTNIVRNKISTIPGLPKSVPTKNNRFDINVSINDLGWLKDFFKIPLELHKPLYINGSVDDYQDFIHLDIDAPSLSYSGNLLENTRANITTYSDTLKTTVRTEKINDDDHRVFLNANMKAADNKLLTNILWDMKGGVPLYGSLNAQTDFYKSFHGKTAIHTAIDKSQLTIDKTKLDILPSEITYIDKTLNINNFKISNNRQHLTINGAVTKNESDSITVDMQNIDVGYVLNLINFHSVSFSGYASGRASIKSLFNTPEANATLKVDSFLFERGRMGTLYANVDYNSTDKQINIKATADDGPDAKTLINGYVSPDRNYIDLGIKAKGTRLEFLESFCGSFMDNVTLRGNGFCRVFGDLKYVNLEGKMVAEGTVDIKPLHTTYTLVNDTITMIPDEIIFKNDSIYDMYGNHGIINGALHHKHLTRLTFDLDVKANNLLSYNSPAYNGNSFYGTVFASGNCYIKGLPGETTLDINVTPEKGSFIEYNAAGHESIAETEFIRWRDLTPQPEIKDDSTLTADENMANNVRQSAVQDIISPQITSDVKLNFIINATPNFTLRVLMDQQTGDYIALNGSGGLRANYFNKGAFEMFGNYLVESGVYKLTIQNIIKKEFHFQPGSSIIFGGDPFGATLDLKGTYTLNAVSLSDLQIGRSFKSNNIRVNCLMNITGTAGTPQVTFDLDLPTLSTDAQQMVRSVINSEEDMNQQVLYLLAVGRFYTQGNNNAAQENANAQSQTSLAMQSLLSGTISQQINTVLSNVVKSSNWNFGANISTGDEGWNNAEYEGLLSGRLLNNRLLINGQFGYRDNVNTTEGSNFIGDFDIRYLLFPSGNLAIKVYNQTNDRYFTRNSLTTQGVGLIMKKDFTRLSDIFGHKKKSKKKAKKK